MGARADWTRVEGCRSPGEEPTEEPKTRWLRGLLHRLCHQAARTRRQAGGTGARNRCLPNEACLDTASAVGTSASKPGSGFPAAILRDLAFTVGDRGSSCRPRPKVTRSKAAALYPRGPAPPPPASPAPPRPCNLRTGTGSSGWTGMPGRLPSWPVTRQREPGQSRHQQAGAPPSTSSRGLRTRGSRLSLRRPAEPGEEGAAAPQVHVETLRTSRQWVFPLAAPRGPLMRC